MGVMGEESSWHLRVHLAAGAAEGEENCQAEIRTLKHDLVLELEKVEENLNKLRLENVELRMLNHYWAMLAFAGFIAIVMLICVVATRMFTHVSEENEKSNIQKISKLISQKADAV